VACTFPTAPKRSPRRARSWLWERASVWKDGRVVPLDVQVNDRILFGKYSGSDIKLDGEEYLIMREDEVLGILDAKPELAMKVPNRS
jgi:chaperonin GroES